MTRGHASWRRLLRRHRPLLSVLALAALGLGVAWTTESVSHVERVSRTLPAPTWREEAAFAYQVPVLDGTPGFPNGTTLPMGEPGYLATISPRVLLNFSWRIADPPEPPAQATLALEAVLDGKGADGRLLWTLREPLANATLDRGARDLAAEGVLDLPALEARVQREIVATGRPQGTLSWRVEARVAFAADLPGEASTAHESLFTLPLAYTPPLYVLPGEDDAAWSRVHGEPRVVVEAHRTGLAALARQPLGPLLGLAGLAALLLLWRDAPPGPRQATLDEVGP